MDDAPDRDTEPVESGYLKLPWQLVAGVLFAILAIALAAGLIASRNLREQLTVPTATPGALAAATATRAAPTASPVATPTSAVTAIPTALPTAAPNQSPSTPVALATAFASPSPRPTVDPGLAEQVTEAYQRYWQLRAEALFALDTSRLDQVAAGEHLDQIVGDNYISNSVFVDATTHDRLTDPAGDNLQEFFTLNRLDGRWKVVNVVRS